MTKMTNNKQIILHISWLISALFFACKENESEKTNTLLSHKLSTDIVSNPASLSDHNDSIRFAKLTFTDTLKKFGNIKEGQVVTHQFEFTNTGNIDLLILDARASCGCTVPSFPKEPIKPGAKDYITISFDTKGKFGINEKSVIITTNGTPANVECYLQANVVR
jgi:Protein of unknown function (DUF1573).